jgi:CRP/FNR family transcriptional regulator, cyclic AMP receptor protein
MMCWQFPDPHTDLIGYGAATLVLLTFLMRGMIPLRLLGLTSNVAFVAYAAAAGLMPILLLHTLLVPINIYRLQQIPQVREALRRLRWRAGRRSHLPRPDGG